MAAAENRILNFNIGVLGHVDSGKTSLSQALSTVASTAAFDKNPQSKERGITLDLGFSSFLLDCPDHLSDGNYKQIQFTLVDCPGHASLIKTIIGGAQIIDLMILVVDVVKGMQTQTAECLVIGEILCERMIVVLNKVDLLPPAKRHASIEKMKKRMLKTLERTRFKGSPVIAVAAKCGGASEGGSEEIGMDELITQLSTSTYVPLRSTEGPLMFSVDHCFSIRGQGTVMTGTVLRGSVAVNDTIEIPALKETKKVKSMQMFRKPVRCAKQGDRVGVCVTQFDPEKLERGVVCTPGYLPTLYGGVIRVQRILYFKGMCSNKTKFHVTVGHETVMARLQFFSPLAEATEENFDVDAEYEFNDEIAEDGRVQYLVLEFERGVVCESDSLVIGSKLDIDANNSNVCRLAFHGRIIAAFTSDPKGFLSTLKIFKRKRKEGLVERMQDDYSVIARSLFKKETKLELFQNMTVRLGTGELGRIEGSFGQSGKIKVRLENALEGATKERLLALSKKNKQKNAEDTNLESAEPVKIYLEFKKYIYDDKHKMIQC